MKGVKAYKLEKKTIKEFEKLKKENEVSYDKMLWILISNFNKKYESSINRKIANKNVA